MILLMVTRVWQNVAEGVLTRIFAFGSTRRFAYAPFTAGNEVTSLPKGYLELHPSPPLGPDCNRFRPLFFWPGRTDAQRGV